MQYRFLTTLNEPLSPRGRAIALGFFDGVHIGHSAVISSIMDTGSLIPCVLTFNQDCDQKVKEGPYILSADDKKIFMDAMGIQEYLDFDFAVLKDMEPEAFVQTVLRDYLHCKLIACGENTRFGKDGAGTVETLKALCSKEGIEVTVVPSVMCEQERVSSTRIRKALADGDIRMATRLLGHPFTINGSIEEGQHLGRTIGYPTMNQPLPSDLILPKFGVYHSSIEIDGVAYPALTNIGIRPTVSGRIPIAETWVPGYTGNTYHKTLRTFLVEFLREETPFASLYELKEQLNKDKRHIMNRTRITGAVRAVFLDFDETLQNRSIAYRRYARRFVSLHFPDLSPDEQERRIQVMWEKNGNGHCYFNRETYISYPDYFKQLIDLWQWEDAPSVDDLVNECKQMLPTESTLFPDSVDLLKALRQKGIYVGVITNGYASMQTRKLDVSGIRPLIDMMVVSGFEGIRKPHGEIFHRAAQRLGVAPEDCLYVGDHPYYDLDGAVNGKMKPIYLDAFDLHLADPSIPRITKPIELLDILA